MAERKSLGKEFTKGLIKENPVLRLVLGTCPTLAVTTSVESALGMGAAALIVLVCSNIVISALRKVIPSKVRILLYRGHRLFCDDRADACESVLAAD